MEQETATTTATTTEILILNETNNFDIGTTTSLIETENLEKILLETQIGTKHNLQDITTLIYISFFLGLIIIFFLLKKIFEKK